MYNTSDHEKKIVDYLELVENEPDFFERNYLQALFLDYTFFTAILLNQSQMNVSSKLDVMIFSSYPMARTPEIDLILETYDLFHAFTGELEKDLIEKRDFSEVQYRKIGEIKENLSTKKPYISLTHRDGERNFFFN